MGFGIKLYLGQGCAQKCTLPVIDRLWKWGMILARVVCITTTCSTFNHPWMGSHQHQGARKRWILETGLLDNTKMRIKITANPLNLQPTMSESLWASWPDRTPYIFNLCWKFQFGRPDGKWICVPRAVKSTIWLLLSWRGGYGYCVNTPGRRLKTQDPPGTPTPSWIQGPNLPTHNLPPTSHSTMQCECSEQSPHSFQAPKSLSLLALPGALHVPCATTSLQWQCSAYAAVPCSMGWVKKICAAAHRSVASGTQDFY